MLAQGFSVSIAVLSILSLLTLCLIIKDFVIRLHPITTRIVNLNVVMRDIVTELQLPDHGLAAPRVAAHLSRLAFAAAAPHKV